MLYLVAGFRVIATWNGSQVRGMSCDFIMQPAHVYYRHTGEIGRHESFSVFLKGTAYFSGRGANRHLVSYRWGHG